ncbi:hypothetical protein ULMS_24420 [Patiriisocius marinistellae]|uniref:Uncharacterized protein n=1 Tax=Patiriisocius marinistellae TaxID=2494560 RepID=A0A5J4G098_9FLAO|nr:DUF3857 domain-containing protein [Patiriisocius marinistellae]GEQ86934.1 hypothetical protein ULMS_24420 [Patiriisocius marinistellae]
MKKIVTLIALLIVVVAFPQNFKPGKVSKKELEETENALNPKSNAAVLYREHRTAFVYNQSKGFEQVTNVFERIKIYNPEGYRWATKKIKSYNHGSDREEVSSIKGTTFNLVGGKVKKTKLDKSNVFKERLNDYFMENKLTMPNLQPGSVIEIEYTVQSPFLGITDIPLQYEIPINKMMVDVKIPDFYVYRNYANPQASNSFTFEESDKNIEVVIRERSGLGTANYGNFKRGGGSSGIQSYKERRYLLEEVNVPPIKRAAYIDNLDNYAAKAVWELTVIKNGNGIPKMLSNSWESVSKTIYERDDFINSINNSSFYEDDLKNALGAETDPSVKMQIVYDLVKNKVRWNGYYGYFPEQGTKKAYKEGKGNVGDVNLLLISMLRKAQINVLPVLISSKSNGIPLFPTRYGFNYLIAQVEIGGNTYLLDATKLYTTINVLPERAINWQGRVILPDGSSDWVPLYPDFSSQKLSYVQAEINPDGTLSAKVRGRMGDHYAKEYRTEFYGKNANDQIDGMDKNGEDVKFSNLETKDLNAFTKNITLSYDANATSLVETINDEIYISPMLFFAQKENPFKENTREYPVFFDFPKSDKYNITIKIPEGYTVKSLPESAKSALAGDAVTYSYLISESNGMIQLAVAMDINKPILLPSDYQFIKDMFGQIVGKENEKIVLSKI